MRMLNIGCGSHYHPAWTNIDIRSNSMEVTEHDVRRGLPLHDRSFDVVYHSHIIEHMTPRDALTLLRECARVLRPGGIIRIATPDLEALARVYLDRLAAALQGVPNADADHRWVSLELFDQMVRDRSGGEMAIYLKNSHIENKEFILSRIGREASAFWAPDSDTRRPHRHEIFTVRRLMRVLELARRELAAALVWIVAGREGRASYQEGAFRRSGEVHRWLYDRFSLANLLREASFEDPQPCAANESRIPHFNTYQLDVSNNLVRKPDSLFMEATIPL